MKNRRDKRILLCSLSAAVLLAAPVLAKNQFEGSNLSSEAQSELSKGLRYFKSKNFTRGTEAIESITNAAPDTSACLYVSGTLDAYGASAAKAKRACMVKALNMARTHEELLNVAIKARRAECFDISKQALDSLVGSTTTFDDLIEIARQAHQATTDEVARIALLKAYTLVDNVPDAFVFCKEASALGQDELVRRCLKDLIEDQTSTTDLVALLPRVSSFEMVDITRLALKRGLEKCKTVDDYLAVYNNAKRYEQEDIVKLAQYRGRKLTLINKIKEERNAPIKAQEDKELEKERKKKEELMRQTGQTPSGF